MSRFVAIQTLVTIEIHLPDTMGVYATLCGVDGKEEGQLQVPVPLGRKVDCDRCKSMWELARTYRASDFSN